MYKNINRIIGLVLLIAAGLCTAVGCKKDAHYLDTGITNARFDGNIMQYLEAKPLYFDTLAQVIKLAGMEDVFRNENITFFAPPDPSIGASIKQLNFYLYFTGKDTVKTLSDIKPKVWKEVLSMYVFKGTSRLKDFRQVDTTALDTYSGQGYLALNNMPMNIGVVYNDAVNGPKEDPVTIKYAGYRQLMISYIPDLSKPKSFWINTLVSSSDINPTNGIVHALKFTNHYFGFNVNRFVSLAIENGIGN